MPSSLIAVKVWPFRELRLTSPSIDAERIRVDGGSRALAPVERDQWIDPTQSETGEIDVIVVCAKQAVAVSGWRRRGSTGVKLF